MSHINASQPARDYDSVLDSYIDAVEHGQCENGKGVIAFHRSQLVERMGRSTSQRDMQGNSLSTEALAWNLDQRLPPVSYLTRPACQSGHFANRQPTLRLTVQKESGYGPPRPPRPAPSLPVKTEPFVGVDTSSISVLRKLKSPGHGSQSAEQTSPKCRNGVPDRRSVTPSLDWMECTLAANSEGRHSLGIETVAVPVLSRAGFTRPQVERRLERLRKKQWSDGWLKLQPPLPASEALSLCYSV